MIYYQEKEKKSIGFIVISLFLIVIIYILVNLINRVDVSLQNINNQEVQEVSSYKSEEVDVTNLVESSMYSIVGISKLKENSTASFMENSEEKLGMGSGIAISQNGYILTNRHLTGGLYSSCYVTLRNGEKFVGKVVWEDENLDIAILETNAMSLPYMMFADSENCELSEKVYLLSNFTGFSFGECVEEGIIKKINSTFKTEDDKYIENVIKVDITINSENTGGAIINENGELIGIVSSENNSVIPISRIQNVLDNLKENGVLEKIDLGIYGFDYKTINYLDENMKLESGVYVDYIEENSILRNYINEKDIITKVDGIVLKAMSELKEYIWSKRKGENVKIYVLKDGIEKILNITL